MVQGEVPVVIISDQHQFVFVEVPKTASTSMKTALMPYNTRPRIARHATLGMILQRYPDVAEYTKFGVRRDLEDWQRSCYRWARRKQDHPVAHRDMTWDEYAESKYVPNWYHRDGISQFLPSWMSCRPDHWLHGCDFTIPFEDLEYGWEQACRILDIPYKRLLHLNRDKHK